ncbi:hypothetical protein M422DRAFT_248261 [Sphaerobolus stellatus SS14]|uniref:Uncharacterized protein n=1 Tax=Sphaerobolus stellatus (strain SS14) TaxID=990650 RepID=A0A0C9VJC3_SPHS4|nr:hypothetical protein M422DRAFT_248261 [Sphaerobolus stellatus SS14]
MSACGSLKLAIEHILTPQEYPTNLHRLELDDEWEGWLESQCAVYINWWFKKSNPEDKDEGSKMFEWKKLYECDHAGCP